MDEGGGEGIRDRITARGEDALGELAQFLVDNLRLHQALQVAFGARERASASASAIRNLNLPTGNDVDRLRAAPARRLGAPRGGRGTRSTGSTGSSPSSGATGRPGAPTLDSGLSPRAAAATVPNRSAAAARSSSPIRRRSPSTKRSDTARTQAVATPRLRPSVNRVAASISTATAPRSRHEDVSPPPGAPSRLSPS